MQRSPSRCNAFTWSSGISFVPVVSSKYARTKQDRTSFGTKIEKAYEMSATAYPEDVVSKSISCKPSSVYRMLDGMKSPCTVTIREPNSETGFAPASKYNFKACSPRARSASLPNWCRLLWKLWSHQRCEEAGTSLSSGCCFFRMAMCSSNHDGSTLCSRAKSLPHLSINSRSEAKAFQLLASAFPAAPLLAQSSTQKFLLLAKRLGAKPLEANRS
mmetsp:Transcript_105390/g.250964  ORF Transcript_105390/g.250964 Transcript_105390/m.250964 type:complete len:216 (-) Transcript_105390:295-942(-)